MGANRQLVKSVVRGIFSRLDDDASGSVDGRELISFVEEALPRATPRAVAKLGGDAATAMRPTGLPRAWHQHAAVGMKSRRSMLDMSKDTTSKNLTALSAPVVAMRRPSGDASSAWIAPRCAWKCFTNSTPSIIFFQNLTWPSLDAVTMKPVAAVTVTCVTTSRCM